jgi:hypothetical protein
MLFSLEIIALGIATFVCAGSLAGTLIQADRFGKILGSILAARVLDCILRGWFRRCWFKPRLQFPPDWGVAGIGLMDAIWVVTLHFPRTTLGLYGGIVLPESSPEIWLVGRVVTAVLTLR